MGVWGRGEKRIGCKEKSKYLNPSLENATFAKKKNLATVGAPGD